MSERNDIICDGCDAVIEGDKTKLHARFKARGFLYWGRGDKNPSRLDLCRDCWQTFWKQRTAEREAAHDS